MPNRKIIECFERPKIFEEDTIYVFQGREDREIEIASAEIFGYRNFSLNVTPPPRMEVCNATNWVYTGGWWRVSRDLILDALIKENDAELITKCGREDSNPCRH